MTCRPPVSPYTITTRSTGILGVTVNKKFFYTWIVVFVLWMIGSFIVHAKLLHGDYAALPNLFRTEADSQQYFPLMIVAHLVLAGAFAWIYICGHEMKPWLPQGLRFGFAVALLTTIPTYTIYYVVQPMPAATVAKQIVFDSILMLILGAAAAYTNRGRQRA
jgi:hypothetical protein